METQLPNRHPRLSYTFISFHRSFRSLLSGWCRLCAESFVCVPPTLIPRQCFRSLDSGHSLRFTAELPIRANLIGRVCLSDAENRPRRGAVYHRRYRLELGASVGRAEVCTSVSHTVVARPRNSAFRFTLTSSMCKRAAIRPYLRDCSHDLYITFTARPTT